MPLHVEIQEMSTHTYPLDLDFWVASLRIEGKWQSGTDNGRVAHRLGTLWKSTVLHRLGDRTEGPTSVTDGQMPSEARVTNHWTSAFLFSPLIGLL